MMITIINKKTEVIMAGIVDEVVNRILGMIEFDDSDFIEGMLESGVPQGIYLSRHAQRVIEEMYPHPEEILSGEEGEEILGSYRHMSSPGLITLHIRAIGSLFWHTVLDLYQHNYYIRQTDLKQMVRLTALKTYRHEQFHHFCDVSRRLFSSPSHHGIEEALAVAWSYHQVEEEHKDARTTVGKLYLPVYRELIARIYRYSSPGYRDWVNYQTASDFEHGLVDYINPPHAAFLEQNGIDLSRLLLGMQRELGNMGTEEVLV